MRRRAAGRAGRPPIALALPASAAVVFLALPLAGVLVRTPWSSLWSELTAPEVRQAFSLSLTVSFSALGLSLLFGVPLAWVLARVDFPGKTLVRALVMLPMVLPPTVGGVALLMGFGRNGVIGSLLQDWFGLTLPFTTKGAVVAAAFVAMPFLVISLEGTLAALHPRYEETAASLGARPLRAFWTVTLPMTAPGLVAGAALCWARALGEFGATITFAGNLPGVTQTLPLQVYLMLQDDPQGATAVSLLLLAVAMAVLLVLRGRWTGTRPAAAGRAQDPAGDAGGSPAGAGALAERPDGAPAGPVEATPWPLAAEVTGYTRLSLSAPPGTTIAVVGPNGAGKTTLLRALLGLTPLSRTETLRLGEVDAARQAPHRRGVAWVPQDGALFPHLTALSNTAYGLRAQGVPRKEARALALDWLERLGVGPLARRKPGRLSGGQAQRVALARALAARPRLLLLDEPLAALDQTTRAHVRHTLREHLAGFAGVCLIVTHDPVEAVSLADQVLVLDSGRQVQYAPPAEVARHPRSPWVARMLGRNAWTGTLAGAELRLPGGARLVAAEAPQDADGRAALAVVGPEAVALHRDRPEGSPRNVWSARVRELTALGGRVRVLATALGEARGLDAIAEITTAAAADLGLADGQEVWVSVKATEITLVAL
ncbi:ABC transporter permease [Streptomyces sp. ICBB 8177]|uniref:ABC transporter permease n=1 Tax=Streptomyces sp. ICBB 8177 TaxID=563922 RepID=UPI000D677182|nr:ABC transporter permease [Streptomyces sp. ICBB 8177]PWI44619.1 molybdate ABC transporter permease subunit [Streptomyces sp. ICBB 8177]